MESSQITGVLVSLDIFRCSVLIVVGKDEETIIKGLPDVYKRKKWGSADGLISLIKEDHCEGDDAGLYTGRTIRNGVDAIVLFLADSISDIPEGTALHELGHAMKHVLKVHGVDDEETEMCTHEYLFNEFLSAKESITAIKENKS